MTKKWIWTGRALSWAMGIFLFTSGLNVLFFRSKDLMEGFAKFGYMESAMPWIGAAALLASVLYLIPATSVLGAILVTGYLGGAVATHLRIGDPTLVAPLTVGVLAWLGLYLQDPRLPALLPLKKRL